MLLVILNYCMTGSMGTYSVTVSGTGENSLLNIEERVVELPRYSSPECLQGIKVPKDIVLYGAFADIVDDIPFSIWG